MAFDQELARKKHQEEEEKLKGFTPKEREEWKRSQTRLSGRQTCPLTQKHTQLIVYLGRQLFERNKIVEDESLLEEGAVSVDFSQYERTIKEEEANEGLEFSDSD